MSQHGGRNIALTVLKNFIKSITPAKRSGEFVGRDYLGTSYYEIPADPQRGKRKPTRWFEAQSKANIDGFDQELPPEWEAWLRGRRAEPPKEEEIMRNLTIMKNKKIKAKELEEAENKTSKTTLPLEPEEQSSFPRYSEYESVPGQRQEK